MPNTRISALVTSCARHDLLKTTLESFYLIVDQVPQELVIYEDSDTPMPEFLTDPIWRGRGLRWIQGGERRGQAYACARLIQEAQFEYTMWMEDDWYFQREKTEFMRESKAILDQYPEVIMVSLRGDSGWHPLIRDPRFPFMIAEPAWRGVWGSYSWNCGVRRTSEMKAIILPNITYQIGRTGLQHEEALSVLMHQKGYVIADLNRVMVTHIGGGRSRAADKLPPLPRILIAIPTCFAFDYETHQMAEDPAKSGFHQNGANEQTQAVRDTWGHDFLAYDNVTVKFFYGKPPGGYPRKPASDEVFLDCGDGYDSLIQKTTQTCRWASEQGFKIMFKADTDTAVYAERLLFEIMENRFDYAGYLHADVCSGGPGYLLSDHAMRIIAHQGTSPRHAYAEDVHVSRVLANAGIRPLMLMGHHSGFSAHFFFPNGFEPSRLTEDVVTLHAVFPEDMRLWHAYTKRRQHGQDQ